MYSFFVLGMIPGTNIQITFTTWTDVALFFLAVYLVARLYRLFTEQRGVFVSNEHHAPLYANQLHVRGL